MHLLKKHICKDPAVLSEIKKRELKIENLINKYRVFLFTVFIIADAIAMHVTNNFTIIRVTVGLPGILLLYFGMFKLHLITKKEKPKPFLKYLTTTIDFLIIFGCFFEAYEAIENIAALNIEQYLLIVTIIFIIINSFSALKIQKQAIVYSALLGITLNTIIHISFGSSLFIVSYTALFILVSGFFNLYISGFIFRFIQNNYRLNQAMEEIKNKNEEIKSQSEEIKTQNDELATQNEYLAKQRDEITLQKKQITSSIEYASLIQKAVLANDTEIKEVVDNYFIVYKPKDIVSGDFYWFKNLNVNNKKYSIFTAMDCTGHGVPGAFMSMLGTSFLNEIANERNIEVNAASMLNSLRRLVKEHLHQESGDRMARDGMDSALCIMDYNEMKLQYAGANNPLFIIRRSNDDSIEEYKADRMPIGIHIKEKESFTNHIIDVEKGDQLYLFSDGYLDQFGGEKGDKFKIKRFRELLLSICEFPLSKQKETLENNLSSWMGEKYAQLDDITILGIKI